MHNKLELIDKKDTLALKWHNVINVIILERLKVLIND